jgi:predicted ATP-dependent endonuclease of OLD family
MPDQYDLTLGGSYGLLPNGFNFELKKGYTALVGQNNAGKSTILQYIFRTLFNRSDVRRDGFCLIPSDRAYINPSTQTGQTLESHNRNLYGRINDRPISFEGVHDTNNFSLYAYLLLSSDYLAQMGHMNKSLNALGFDQIVSKDQHIIHMSNTEIHRHGAGIRSVLPILAALTSPNINVILIDEPELSLEARAQKALKDILISSTDKMIVVATQSHLFINKTETKNNVVVEKINNVITTHKVSTNQELLDLTYKLLGNSLEDLFFPNNFLIVEGSSDQVIAEKVASLLDINHYQVKIVAVKGMDNVLPFYNTLENTLTPLILETSPYSKKVVVLLDKPLDDSKLDEFKRNLKDNRLFNLGVNSIEEYLPEILYQKGGRDKETDLKKLESLKGHYKELSDLKKQISNAISAKLEQSDLMHIPKIVEAIRKAASYQ